MTNPWPANDIAADEPPTAERPLAPDWPCCPRCGRRRAAVCPYCRTTGDDFPWADPIPAAAPLQPTRSEAVGIAAGGLPVEQLLCPLCSEPQSPQFLRHCRGCGHEFADGKEPAARWFDRATRRAFYLFCAVMALVAAVLLYFRHVLQR